MIGSLSFEFYPPRNAEGEHTLARTVERLAERRPEFFSVTYGAGGSTRDGTLATVTALRAAGHDAAPHLSFGGASHADIRALVQRYLDLGIHRIVALRGDAPSGIGTRGNLAYAAELVQFLRAEFGAALTVHVAAYPEVHPDAPSPQADLDFFAGKVRAGADGAITQYFYNADAYFDFCRRARAAGVTVPIVPGIMPITNHEGLVRFSANCGADIPRWVLLRLQALAGDLPALREFGADVVTDLCRRLLDGGAPGLHFYTLNLSGPTLRILDRLAPSATPDR